MLVLARKINQRIVISIDGREATLEILKVDGNRVRIGIDAPPEISIMRAEVETNFAPRTPSLCCDELIKQRTIA